MIHLVLSNSKKLAKHKQEENQQNMWAFVVEVCKHGEGGGGGARGEEKFKANNFSHSCPLVEILLLPPQ